MRRCRGRGACQSSEEGALRRKGSWRQSRRQLLAAMNAWPRVQLPGWRAWSCVYRMCRLTTKSERVCESRRKLNANTVCDAANATERVSSCVQVSDQEVADGPKLEGCGPELRALLLEGLLVPQVGAVGAGGGVGDEHQRTAVRLGGLPSGSTVHGLQRSVVGGRLGRL